MAQILEEKLSEIIKDPEKQEFLKYRRHSARYLYIQGPEGERFDGSILK